MIFINGHNFCQLMELALALEFCLRLKRKTFNFKHLMYVVWIKSACFGKPIGLKHKGTNCLQILSDFQ